MTWGTSHFVSRIHAVRYYLSAECHDEHNARAAVAASVAAKLREGAIHIGPPRLGLGQTLSIIDGGTRYAITEEVRS